MFNIQIKTLAIMVAGAIISGCGSSTAQNLAVSKACPPGTFLSVNAPTLQVSTIAIIPTVLQSSTSFFNTTNINTGVTTATVMSGPTGIINDSIFTTLHPTGVPLANAVATLLTTPPSSILLPLDPPALSMTATSCSGNSGGSPCPTASLTPLAYADFGVWAIKNFDFSYSPPPVPIMTYIAFAGGTQLTTTMPTTGSVTYTGKMTGVLANSPVGGSDDVSGTITLTVNFTSSGGTISSLLISSIVPSPGVSTLPAPCQHPSTPLACTYTAYAPLLLPALPTSFADITMSSGSISGNNLVAQVTTLSVPGATTTALNGKFYGTNANEVAGTFTISVQSPGSGPALGMALIGSFGAKP